MEDDVEIRTCGCGDCDLQTLSFTETCGCAGVVKRASLRPTLLSAYLGSNPSTRISYPLKLFLFPLT